MPNYRRLPHFFTRLNRVAFDRDLLVRVWSNLDFSNYTAPSRNNLHDNNNQRLDNTLSQAPLNLTTDAQPSTHNHFVVNIGDAQSSVNQVGIHSATNSSQPSEQTNDNGRIQENESNWLQSLFQNPELQTVAAALIKCIPFLIILLCKSLYTFRIGIINYIFLQVTFSYANKKITTEIGKQSNRSLLSLVGLSVNILTCISLVYYVFSDEGLHFCLLLLPPHLKPQDVWTLIWIVGVTDYIVKLLTIFIKIIFTSFPSSLLHHKQRGKYYLFTERTSQLYRTILPIQTWLQYLLEPFDGFDKVVAVVLSASYVVFKVKTLAIKFNEWTAACSKLLKTVSCGDTPTKESIDQVNNQCPICQDDLVNPTMLKCKHIFCEECVIAWFNHNRTCPMCRMQVSDDPSWRDGSTTPFIQLF